MTSIIDSFAFPVEKQAIMEEFKKIAKREGKSKSELNMELIEQHVKSHGNGNPVFKLDQFQDPEFIAMPATMSPKDQWNEYIRKHMNLKERVELADRVKFVLATIEAAAWEENKNVKIPDRT